MSRCHGIAGWIASKEEGCIPHLGSVMVSTVSWLCKCIFPAIISPIYLHETYITHTCSILLNWSIFYSICLPLVNVTLCGALSVGSFVK